MSIKKIFILSMIIIFAQHVYAYCGLFKSSCNFKSSDIKMQNYITDLIEKSINNTVKETIKRECRNCTEQQQQQFNVVIGNSLKLNINCDNISNVTVKQYKTCLKHDFLTYGKVLDGDPIAHNKNIIIGWDKIPGCDGKSFQTTITSNYKKFDDLNDDDSGLGCASFVIEKKAGRYIRDVLGKQRIENNHHQFSASKVTPLEIDKNRQIQICPIELNHILASYLNTEQQYQTLAQVQPSEKRELLSDSEKANIKNQALIDASKGINNGQKYKKTLASVYYMVFNMPFQNLSPNEEQNCINQYNKIYVLPYMNN